MPNPKIRQRLGVHANPATQPLICHMLLAQPRNELEGRIGQPLENISSSWLRRSSETKTSNPFPDSGANDNLHPSRLFFEFRNLGA
jgi:hypothetical protein